MVGFPAPDSVRVGDRVGFGVLQQTAARLGLVTSDGEGMGAGMLPLMEPFVTLRSWPLLLWRARSELGAAELRRSQARTRSDGE
jgi:hypothetical protein